MTREEILSQAYQILMNKQNKYPVSYNAGEMESILKEDMNVCKPIKNFMLCIDYLKSNGIDITKKESV